MTFVEVQGGALQGKFSADVFDAAQRPVRRDQQLSGSLLDRCGQHLWRQVLRVRSGQQLLTEVLAKVIQRSKGAIGPALSDGAVAVYVPRSLRR